MIEISEGIVEEAVSVINKKIQEIEDVHSTDKKQLLDRIESDFDTLDTKMDKETSEIKSELKFCVRNLKMLRARDISDTEIRFKKQGD